MTEILHPWDIDPRADRAKWGVGYLNIRGFTTESFVYREPADEKLLHRIDKIVEWSLGSRNWIVCIGESTVYSRQLFSYVMATYVFTTNLRAIVVDVDDMIVAADDPEGEMRDIIEYADLLIVLHCDCNNQNFKWRKGSIANILHRRKFNDRATILDTFMRSIPENIDSTKAGEFSRKYIVETFGETVAHLFGSTDSKRVIIRPEREGGSNGRRGVASK